MAGQRLTAPTEHDPGLVIHLRTDHDRLLETTRTHLAALVRDLGEKTSATVFDAAGDQIAHLVGDPAQH